MDGRLTQSQKRAFKRKHGLVDDITGEHYTPQEIQQLIIAHIKPVAIGGCRDWDNLALLHQDTEKKINDLAKQLSRGNMQLEWQLMEYLTRVALELASIKEP